MLPPEPETKVEETFVPFPKWISASAGMNVECRIKNSLSLAKLFGTNLLDAAICEEFYKKSPPASVKAVAISHSLSSIRQDKHTQELFKIL